MAFYPLILVPDDNDTILVTSPAFDELVTFGEDRDDALFRAQSAIFVALADRIARGVDIPAPLTERPEGDAIAVPALLYLKCGLYMLLRHKGQTRADLMRLLGWNRESVDRLFRLDHQSRLDNIEAAYAALGASVRIEAPALDAA